MTEPVMAVWDLEASNLDADMATWLTSGFQRFTMRKGKVVLIDPEPVVKTIAQTREFRTDRTNDAGVAKWTSDFINSLDVLIGFYSTGFDIRFAQGKMGEHGLDFIPTFGRRHIDLYYSGKKMKLTSGGLANVCRHLGIPGKKTYLDKKIWRRAGAGYVDAIDYIAEHNVADVKLTLGLYKRLAPLVYQHPIVGDKKACWCGNVLIRRGPAFTASKTQQYRFQCKGTPSHWQTRSI